MDENPYSQPRCCNDPREVAKIPNPTDYFTMITDWLNGARQAAPKKVNRSFDVKASRSYAHQRDVNF